jgi:hypothetical protein
MKIGERRVEREGRTGGGIRRGGKGRKGREGKGQGMSDSIESYCIINGREKQTK